MMNQTVKSSRERLLTTAPVQVERVAALTGTVEIGRWAELGAAADRLRIAQAVVDQLTGPRALRRDPSVIALASEELHQAEQRYLQLTCPPVG
jgi:hypothetical protein